MVDSEGSDDEYAFLCPTLIILHPLALQSTLGCSLCIEAT